MSLRNAPFLRLALTALALAASLAAALPQRLAAAPQLTVPAASDLELTADDPVEFDANTREMVARRNARLAYGDLELRADEIRFEQATGKVTATGHLLLCGPGFRLVGEKAIYELVSRSLEIGPLRFGQPPFVAEAAGARGTLDNLRLEKVSLFVGEPAATGPRVDAPAITITGGKKVSAESATPRIGRIPLLKVPHLKRRFDGPSVNGRLRLGASAPLGGYIRPTLVTPLSSTVDFAGGLEVYTRRGVLLSPGIEYTVDGASGSLQSGWIHDWASQSRRGLDLLDQPIGRERWFADWRHAQSLAAAGDVAVHLSYASDSEVLRDFRRERFDRREQEDSWAEWTWTRGQTVLSAFTRLRADDYQRVVQRLPELRAEGLPQAFFGTPLRLKWFADAAHLVLDDPADGTDRRLTRLDGYAGLSLPISLGKLGVLTPLAGGRLTWYNWTRGGEDGLRGLGELGFDLNLGIHRSWEYANARWQINGLRHTVEPVLSYRWIGGADTPSGLPQVEMTAFSTYLPPLGLDGSREVDALGRRHVLRAGLMQRLETRSSGYGSRELARLYLGADWHLSGMPGVRRASALHADLALTPASWLELGLFQRYGVQDGRVEEINPRLVIRDGRWWSAGLSSHFLRGQFEEYSLEGTLRLNEVWSLGGRLRYDRVASRWAEQSLTVVQTLSNIWRLEYRIGRRSGTRQEDGLTFGIGVDLLAF